MLKSCKGMQTGKSDQMNVTQGHHDPEKGQGLLLRMGKGLGTPNAPKRVGLSNVIPLECVAYVGIKCQEMYAIRQDELCHANGVNNKSNVNKT